MKRAVLQTSSHYKLTATTKQLQNQASGVVPGGGPLPGILRIIQNRHYDTKKFFSLFQFLFYYSVLYFFVPILGTLNNPPPPGLLKF